MAFRISTRRIEPRTRALREADAREVEKENTAFSKDIFEAQCLLRKRQRSPQHWTAKHAVETMDCRQHATVEAASVAEAFKEACRRRIPDFGGDLFAIERVFEKFCRVEERATDFGTGDGRVGADGEFQQRTPACTTVDATEQFNKFVPATNASRPFTTASGFSPTTWSRSAQRTMAARPSVPDGSVEAISFTSPHVGR